MSDHMAFAFMQILWTKCLLFCWVSKFRPNHLGLRSEVAATFYNKLMQVGYVVAAAVSPGKEGRVRIVFQYQNKLYLISTKYHSLYLHAIKILENSR